MISSPDSTIDLARLRVAYLVARDALLAERAPAGHWVGELSTSALSTATAVMALHLVNPFEHQNRVAGGMRWLADHQNPDGGWGDTTRSVSNISTSMLVRAAFALTSAVKDHPVALENLEAYLTRTAGKSPEQRAGAIRRRYGKDRTFSVPILMSAALAGLVTWREVPRLPFELACLPQSWYRFARLPVVSYALPALIAIGQCVHHHRVSWNPLRNVVRWLAEARTLTVLRRIQPTTGGYLEATPLTSFVVMALSSVRRQRSVAERAVIDEGVRFLVSSVRPDGSWPIDTNLSTWVTTLSVSAFAAAGDLDALDTKAAIREWLLNQQYRERHPYTGAEPGGWAWTDLPGGVPDCDDTPGALLALHLLDTDTPPPAERVNHPAYGGLTWTVGLLNPDGGWPTFCRGWGALPFDRSGSDLTAHVLRAYAAWGRRWFGYRPGTTEEDTAALERATRDAGTAWTALFQFNDAVCDAAQAGIAYLARKQRADGSWLPLWFGNQYADDDINPVYGTSRVLAAYRDLGLTDTPECQRGVAYLLAVQNSDGGWGGAAGCSSSVEETALAVEVLLDLAPDKAAHGVRWLVVAVETGRFREPSPIGFYFAKLWYYEKLYPLIFTVAALGRACRS